MNRRIGLFGGTFNPPHIGHLHLALEAVKQASLDRVIVMPANIPPHKEAHDLCSGEDRLALCRATFTDELFEISDFELRQDGKSYTVNTLRALRETMPGDELFLIVGSDMFLSFHQWREYRAILSMCKLIVLSRETEISAEILRDYAQETLGLFEQNGDFILISADIVKLSSSEIRERIRTGCSVCGLVAEQAETYMQEKGLYR